MAPRVAELKQTEGGSAATVREAIGERLRATLAPAPAPAPLPPRLQTLLDQLRLHDTETEPRSR